MHPALSPLMRPTTAGVLGLALAGGVSHAALAASADNNVEWDGIHADTTAQFVTPMAPTSGQAVTIRLRAFANDLTAVKARVWLSGPNTESMLTLTAKPTLPGAAFTTWEASLTPPANTTALYWRFEVTDGTDTDHYDAGNWNDDPRYRGMSDDYRGDDSNFQLPIGFSTPTWSHTAIWYQIFPDRFYNGETDNDSLSPDDDMWYLDWAPEGTGTAKDCEVHASWSEAPTGPCDFFGGDLQGINQKLSYLQTLNVNALYLNPVFRSRSNHKYDTMDYTEVDPRFGGNNALDGLMTNAHDKGWRVILDGVFNHSSDSSVYYNAWADQPSDPFYPQSTGVWEQLMKSQGESPWDGWFKTWVGTDTFDVDRDGNLTEPALHTCGWYGFEFMPNFDFKAPSQPDSEPRVWLYGGSQSTTSSAARASIGGMWVGDRAELLEGADGWRLDVPDNAGYSTSTAAGNCSWASNDPTIWQGFRKAVKTANPDAYITGEIWADASTNGGQNWFFNQTFDAVMNYHYFAMPVTCYLNGSGVHEAAGSGTSPECVNSYATMKKGGASDLKNLDAHLANQRRVYPASAYFANQNLISSHDTSRWVSRTGSSTETMKSAYWLQATVPGAPMVYYADELGATGGNDPDNRKPFPWDQIDAAGAADMRKLLSKLLCVRTNTPALATGSFHTLDLDSTNDTWAFARWDGADVAVVGLNLSGATRTLRIPVAKAGVGDGTVIDAVSGDVVTVTAGIATVTLDAREGVVLVSAANAPDTEACRVTNQAPVADAGADPLLLTTDDDIVLDGAGSFDPDGSALTYVWTNDAGGVVGNTAVVTLPPRPAGSYLFFLTVSDGSLSSTDSVEVIVEEAQTGGCQPNGIAAGPVPSRGGLGWWMLLPAVFIRRIRRRP